MLECSSAWLFCKIDYSTSPNKRCLNVIVRPRRLLFPPLFDLTKIQLANICQIRRIEIDTRGSSIHFHWHVIYFERWNSQELKQINNWKISLFLVSFSPFGILFKKKTSKICKNKCYLQVLWIFYPFLKPDKLH